MGTLLPLRTVNKQENNHHLRVFHSSAAASLLALQKREIKQRKRVVLALGKSLPQGIPVTLQIGDEDNIPDIAMTGWLPPVASLLTAYEDWQKPYQQGFTCSDGFVSRLSTPAAQVTNLSVQEIWQRCCLAEEILVRRINQWLNSELFRPVRETLLAYCHPRESIRLILQTDDLQIQKLPLHRWDWFDRYSQAELILGSNTYAQADGRSNSQFTAHPRILAVLGDSQGLDIEHDVALLKNLPNAAVTCLREPMRSQLNEALWDNPWDIILFAGHSECANHAQCQTKFQLNAHESLSLNELKYGLKRAIAQNLKLLILNTCDSLTLLKELSRELNNNLCLPATIAMRQPVPDVVAQTFLRYFLTPFSQGQTLPCSVREAREKLQGIEHQFPFASSIPVLYQTL
ncbi:MAG: CHAT domain-containing protein [Cyanobacteria bacterium P01_D01_bin.105]